MASQSIIKTIQCLVYALVVAVPLIYFPTGIFPFQIVKIVFFQIIVEVIFALWLVLVIFDERFRPRLTPVFIALDLFLIIAFLSAIWGVDWRISLWSDEQRTLGLISLFHLAALFTVLSSLRGEINWRKVWFLSFGVAVAISLIAISQIFFVADKTSTNQWIYIIYQKTDRPGATFSNPAFMAGYLLFNFFIGLYLFAKQKTQIRADKNVDKRRYIDWFLLGGTILIFLAIFFSQTLGVILGLLVGILFLLLYFIFKGQSISVSFYKFPPVSLRRISLFLLTLLIFFSGVAWFTRDNKIWQGVPSLGRLAQISPGSISVYPRLLAWQSGSQAFLERPIFGWGFENFRIAFDRHYNPGIMGPTISGSHWDKPHNAVLEHFVNSGIFGGLAYLSIFVAAFYSLTRINTDGKTDERGYISVNPCFHPCVSVFLAAALIAYFVQNLFIFDTVGTYLMFFLMMAYIDSMARMDTDVNTNKHRYIRDNPFSDQRESVLDKNQQLWFKIVMAIVLLIIIVPAYYNIQIFQASRDEYWGVNYFLNQLPESSFVSFSQALTRPTPYKDDIRRNFAGTVKQAYEQGIEYPSLAELQKKLVEYLKEIIKRHPEDFLNYVILAEFQNAFYQYNPDEYLKSSEELVERAMELSPNRQQVYYVEAKTSLLRGDIKGAYEAFGKAVLLNPEAADPHFYFGLMAYGLGDFKKGAAEIAEAERLGRKPRNAQEAIALANFLGDHEKNYKKAIELYQFALSVSEPRMKPNILLKLGVAYYFDGDHDQARETFRTLKSLVDFKTIPIYSDLQPILKDLGIGD